MDYTQTLLVLLSVLLCSSQGLTESSTEPTLVQTPPETSARLQPQEVSTYREEKQFVLFHELKNWTEAYNDCTKRNMMLASIESEEENNKVRSLFKNTDMKWFFWLSGTDLGYTGRYVWKSTGRDVTYNQWRQGQPNHYVYSNGEVDHCMYVHSCDMLWGDYSCSYFLSYICQHWV